MTSSHNTPMAPPGSMNAELLQEVHAQVQRQVQESAIATSMQIETTLRREINTVKDAMRDYALKLCDDGKAIVESSYTALVRQTENTLRGLITDVQVGLKKVSDDYLNLGMDLSTYINQAVVNAVQIILPTVNQDITDMKKEQAKQQHDIFVLQQELKQQRYPP